MPETLTPNQRKGIEALANGYTRAKAAEFAGVTERTVYNWLRDDRLFAAELARARDAVFRAGVTQLSGHLERAVDTLGKALAGEPMTPEQVRAANYLLAHGKAYTELAHFGEKLEQAIADIAELKGSYETDNNSSPGIVPGDIVPSEEGGIL